MIVQAAGVAGAAEFFAGWLKAQPGATAHSHSNASAPPEPDRWSSYHPKFFSPVDFQNLESFTSILIPTDDTPGAREAHVAPFIDFVVDAAAQYAPEMQQQWREAMQWLHTHQFQSLSPEQQLSLVRQMSEGERDRSELNDGLKAYRLIKDMTIHAFYTSRAGLVDTLEYKGNAYLVEFPACTHPEHQRV